MDSVELILEKHGVESTQLFGAPGEDKTSRIRLWLSDAEPDRVEAILEEEVRTQGSLRNRVSPRYIYDERYRDLEICLALDGYLIENAKLLRTEPDLGGPIVLEDDLTRELHHSSLSEAENVVRLLNNSAENFRRNPADLNATLTNARVALETLAKSISQHYASSRPSGFDESKWGQVVAHLRTCGFLNESEEKGLTGAFSFVSPGAHLSVGPPETEMVRLGRSLVVSMCYFLAKRYNA